MDTAAVVVVVGVMEDMTKGKAWLKQEYPHKDVPEHCLQQFHAG